METKMIAGQIDGGTKNGNYYGNLIFNGAVDT